jgi:DNA-binding response OmpR family regulator
VACVLVVEDEQKIRDLLRSYLGHDGLDVITTGSGADAIRFARQAAPDLIMLDLRLHDVPGEVARERHAMRSWSAVRAPGSLQLNGNC